jgi:hypothetical protein
LAMRSPIVQMPAMGVLDHFHGAWLIAAYGFAALPNSIVLAAACIGTAGLWAACQRPVSTTS